LGIQLWWVIAVTFFSQLIAVIAWFFSFPKLPSFKIVPALFGVRLAGESFAQINPASIAGGDPLKGVILKHTNGIKLRDSAMSIFLSRVMITVSSGLMIVFAVILLYQRFELIQMKIASLIITFLIVLATLFTIYSLKNQHGVFLQYSKFFE
jgi:hypothetical protein